MNRRVAWIRRLFSTLAVVAMLGGGIALADDADPEEAPDTWCGELKCPTNAQPTAATRSAGTEDDAHPDRVDVAKPSHVVDEAMDVIP